MDAPALNSCEPAYYLTRRFHPVGLLEFAPKVRKIPVLPSAEGFERLLKKRMVRMGYSETSTFTIACGALEVSCQCVSRTLGALSERKCLSKLDPFRRSLFECALVEFVEHFQAERLVRGNEVCFYSQLKVCSKRLACKLSAASGSGASFDTTVAPHDFLEHTGSISRISAEHKPKSAQEAISTEIYAVSRVADCRQ
jgi:hypothetical protein